MKKGKSTTLRLPAFGSFIYGILIVDNSNFGSSVVECLTPDRGAAGSSLTGVTALCPRARHINPSLVLFQPRKTRHFITEKLLMGRKESNQIKQTINSNFGLNGDQRFESLEQFSSHVLTLSPSLN